MCEAKSGLCTLGGLVKTSSGKWSSSIGQLPVECYPEWRVTFDQPIHKDGTVRVDVTRKGKVQSKTILGLD